jgi:hypothetical protein
MALSQSASSMPSSEVCRSERWPGFPPGHLVVETGVDPVTFRFPATAFEQVGDGLSRSRASNARPGVVDGCRSASAGLTYLKYLRMRGWLK